ncbi:MAG: NAD(P)-dependent oxidoreductase [Clostridiales bacterium]|nr:NAD(P)-dependent oxidoreductase [Clostridiales bacterium]
MKRAVVTGATGMLAIALTNLLVKEGYDVIAVIRPGSSRAGNVPVSENVTVVELDMDEISSLPEVLSASGIDEAELFFHFAWDGTHGDSRNDMDIQIKNVRYSVEAVRAAAKIGCKAFMGAGSQAEYGRVKDGIKLSGDTPCFPENGYGIGKLAAGQMTRVEAKKFGMKHVWVRILSTYGAYDGMHTMVMSGIKTMLEGKKASYTKGEQMWDYLYCKDAARAFFLALTKGVDGKVYPVGSGKVRPLKEYIEAIRDEAGPSLDIGFGEVEYYPGQVMYLCADISELTKDTGFEPEYSFEEGIKETVDWYRKEYLK